MTSGQLSRTSGVLLHPTSLPGGQGIGDIGATARAFVDRLASANQSWWQVLPLNPPDYLGSPYSATSAMAISPLLCDLEDLVARGWLDSSQLAPDQPGRIDFDAVAAAKNAALRTAWERARARSPMFPEDGAESLDFEAFCAREDDEWLDDWALFSALRTTHGGGWQHWPDAIVRRDDEALAQAREELADEVGIAKFVQWVLFEQWRHLRSYAKARGVDIIGDIPIFVAMDSADVWARRGIFEVDDDGSASVVAGVPPDYFSPTGQKWGNPLYRWDALRETDYDFWRARIRVVRELCGIVRIDHFRGFESYWAVPAAAPTAEIGHWRRGPGVDFFRWVEHEFGTLPFIAEDLGMITDAVHHLRRRTGLPGMKVMHFAFDGTPDHPFLPHTYPENCVAYTGTHDNDTTLGWYRSAGERIRHNCRTYLRHADTGIVWAMIDALLASNANLAIVPFQDLHELGTEARINLPGTSSPDNWSWRMSPGLLDDARPWKRLAELTRLYGR